MAMNEKIKGLIRAVSNDDMKNAKAYAKIIVESETAASNAGFCNTVKAKLSAPSANMIELPQDLRGILTMEYVAASFNERRYFFSDREKYIFDQIATANKVNGQLLEMGIQHLNATLLHGESGTGKTTFGRYIAYKLGLPFAYLNFSHCISSYLGSTGRNIAKVFEYMSKQKCVMMLDEVDAIGSMRGGKDDVGEMSRVTIGLMQALDQMSNDVIVIGATNRPDILDAALIRRFTLQHEVKTLQSWEALELIKTYLADVGIDYDEEELAKYAKSNSKQSTIVNDLVRAIVEMLANDTKFRLTA